MLYRASASSGRNYLRLEEGKAINLSLCALGNCMNALATGKSHIPYRDSKLTRLLQGSLGGGARTSVIVAVAPSAKDETGEILLSLRFAARASQVKVQAKVVRYIDYEALFNETQKLLDAKSDECLKQTLLRERETERAEQLRSELDAARGEISSLKNTIKLLTATSSSTNENGSSNTSASSQLTQEQFHEKLQQLSESHLAEMETLRKSLEKKVSTHSTGSDSGMLIMIPLPM
jgi:predicted RNA-binding protein with RPS1 domain